MCIIRQLEASSIMTQKGKFNDDPGNDENPQNALTEEVIELLVSNLS